MRDTREGGRGGQSPRTAREPAETNRVRVRVLHCRAKEAWQGTLGGVCAVEEEGEGGASYSEMDLSKE
jgi:hypothetical protein